MTKIGYAILIILIVTALLTPANAVHDTVIDTIINKLISIDNKIDKLEKEIALMKTDIIEKIREGHE